jgi:iron complex outermembrane receptor protein
MSSAVLLNRGCLVAAILLMTLMTEGALAEEAGASSDQPAGLEEIVVTAQRRSENIQHAALAVDVVSTQALGLAGANRASDLPNAVPALQVGEFGNGQQSLYIRSVGTMTANSYSDPAIAFNVDGVAIGRPSSMTGVMYDLQRVEVLKGPQGTLYGRNATGGAINILPNLPKLGVTAADVALTVGNHSEVHPEAALNLAVSDSSAARIAFTYAHHDGYQTDGTGDANNYAARAQYLFQPSDSLSLRLAGDYAHDGGHNVAGTLMALQSPFTGEVTNSPLPRNAGMVDTRVSGLLATQYSFISGRFFGPIDGTPNTDNRFWGVLAELNWHSPMGTLTLLPAHRDSKLNDFTTALGFGEYAAEHDRQSSIELRLASENEGLLRWLLGGYYFDEGVRATYQFNQQALAPLQTLDTGTTSEAAFAHLTVAPVDQFRITGGLRYTHDSKSFDGLSQILLSVCGLTSPIPACPAAPLIPLASSFASVSSQLQLFPIIPNVLYGSTLPGAGASVFPINNIPIDKTQNFSKFTWHGGLEYDLTPDSLLYASWDTGYHAGGFAFAEIKPTYNPERLSAYSIGSKNRFLHAAVQLNLEAFYWKYRDQQISHGATDLNGTYVFYTDNAGSSTIKGGEIEVKYLLPTHTVLNLDVQYLDAAYDSFTYQTPAGGTNGPPVTGCPFAQSDSAHYTVDCSGKTPLMSPKWTGNIGIQQTVQLGNYALIGEFTTHYQTSSIIGFEMVPVERQSAFAESNVSLTLAADSERWSVTAFGNNLQDKRPYGNAYYNSIMNVYAASVGAPRTWGVRAAMRF